MICPPPGLDRVKADKPCSDGRKRLSDQMCLLDDTSLDQDPFQSPTDSEIEDAGNEMLLIEDNDVDIYVSCIGTSQIGLNIWIVYIAKCHFVLWFYSTSFPGHIAFVCLFVCLFVC